MTATFGTNANNDIYLGNDGNLVVLTALPAVMAACKTASQAQLGEMILMTGLGIPNFQAAWVGTPNYALWASYLTDTLNSVDGVNSVASLELSMNGDVLEYTATISSEYGEAEIASSTINND